MWRWVLPGAVVVAVLIGFVASRNGPTQHAAAHAPPVVSQPPPTSTASAAAPTCGTKHGQQARIRHVVWIWMGTQGYTHMIGKLRTAPYINQLAEACGLATRYTAITHPAIANNVGALAGDPHGLVHNSCDTACTTTAPTLLSQVGWRAFVGGMPGACRKLAAARVAYDRLSNPPTYVTPPRCRQSDLPLGSPKSGPLQRAIARNSLPEFTLIVPDGCHNSGFNKHCTGKRKRSTFLAKADLWLHDWIATLTDSPAYKSGSTVIFITWNQGSPAKPLRIDCTARPASGSCQVPLIVVSPYVKPGTASPAALSHYSLLGATERLLGVARLGHAAGPSGQTLLRAFGL